MQFTVTILGSGSASAHATRFPSAQILTVNHEYYLIDCGEGTQYRLLENKIKPSKLKAIFISHLHGDHYFGLFGLLNSLSLGHRKEPLTVYSPKGLRDILIEVFRWSDTKLTYPFSIIEVDTESTGTLFQHEHLTVEHFPLNHRVPCTGYCFRYRNNERSIIKERLKPEMTFEQIKLLKKGINIVSPAQQLLYSVEEYTLPPPPERVYTYCSDTSFLPSIVEHIKGTTTLYHEATFLSDLEELANYTLHSTAKQAAQIAHLAKVQNLLLGHLSSRYIDFTKSLQEAREVFANTEAATENTTFVI